MKIILAQLIKDIRCQKTPLILWVVCLGFLAVGMILPAVIAQLTSISYFGVTNEKLTMAFVFVCMLAVAGMGIAILGLYILVPILMVRIVHQDVLMGTTAFWLTRPLPREKLLAAKVLLITALLLPVLLVTIGTHAHFSTSHFEPDTQMEEGHDWVSRLAWISAFAAVASVTATTQRFIAIGAGLFFGKDVLTLLLGQFWSYAHGYSPGFFYRIAHQFSSLGGLLYSNGADIFHLCYFAGFSAVFIHQYLTLQTRRSGLILITTILVVSFLETAVGSK